MAIFNSQLLVYRSQTTLTPSGCRQVSVMRGCRRVSSQDVSGENKKGPARASLENPQMVKGFIVDSGCAGKIYKSVCFPLVLSDFSK